MKAIDILNSIGNVDDRFIKETDMLRRRQVRVRVGCDFRPLITIVASFIVVCTAAIIILSKADILRFSPGGDETKPTITDATTTTEETTVTTTETTTIESTTNTAETKSIIIEGFDYSALEMIGYYVDEKENRLMLDNTDWEVCDPDIFREYMFGTWENFDPSFWNDETNVLILDDSEDNYDYNLKFAYEYYQKDDIIIYIISNYQSHMVILWLDINEPDIMYYEDTNGLYLFTLSREEPEPSEHPDNKIKSVTRINSQINEPENGYMSRLRLYELMEEYDIDFDMIFDIEYTAYDADGNSNRFYMDGDFSTFPIYLISEEPEKLTFKSKISSGLDRHYVDVEYVIEKKDGKWERTVEINEEQLEEALIKLAE